MKRYIFPKLLLKLVIAVLSIASAQIASASMYFPETFFAGKTSSTAKRTALGAELQKCGFWVDFRIRALECIELPNISADELIEGLKKRVTLRREWLMQTEIWPRVLAEFAEREFTDPAQLLALSHSTSVETRALALLIWPPTAPDTRLKEALDDGAWVAPFSATVADFAFSALKNRSVDADYHKQLAQMSMEHRHSLNTYRDIFSASENYRAHFLVADPNWRAHLNPPTDAALVGLSRFASLSEAKVQLNSADVLVRLVALDVIVSRHTSGNDVAEAFLTVSAQEGRWRQRGDRMEFSAATIAAANVVSAFRPVQIDTLIGQLETPRLKCTMASFAVVLSLYPTYAKRYQDFIRRAVAESGKCKV